MSNEANNLIMFARTGKLSELRKLIKICDNIDEPGRYGWSALMHACYLGQTEAARILLDHGANIHFTEEDGTTALHAAIFMDRVECTQLLLERGANPAAPDKDGCDAHALAIKHHRTKVTPILAAALNIHPPPLPSISYNIDKILKSPDFLIDIHNALYNPVYAKLPSLHPEEEVLFWIAEFHVMTGGGFGVLFENENFDVIFYTLAASKKFPNTLLYQAFQDLEKILNNHQFPHDYPAFILHFFELTQEKFENLHNQITELDRQYFFGSPSLWGDSQEYIDATKDYALQHRELLIDRKL